MVSDAGSVASPGRVGDGGDRAALPFLGRTVELDALDAAMRDAMAGALRVVVIEGEAGIGKTTLLDQVARRAAAGGAAVVRIGHDAVSSRLPFAAIADALGGTLPTAPSNRRHADRTANHPERHDHHDHDDHHDQQAELFGGQSFGISPADLHGGVQVLLGVIEQRAMAGPIALLVDDIHFADAATLVLLGALPRRLLGLPILLVLATRPTPQTESLDALLATLRSSAGTRGGAIHVPLDALDEPTVLSLAEHLLGTPADERLRHAIGAASGNPFFVTEIVAAQRGHHSADSWTSTTLPAHRRQAVLDRLQPCSPEVLRLLELAAILGDRVKVADLAALAGRPITELWEPLRAAIRAGVVRESEHHLTFRHHLVRAAIYDNVPAPLRASMHLDVAQRLAALGRSVDDVAAHYVSAGELADSTAVPALLRSARNRARHDPPGALALLDRAASLCTPGQIALIDADRGNALAWASQFDEAIEVSKRALDRTDDAATRAALRVAASNAMLATGRAGEASSMLHGIVDDISDPSVRAMACAVAAMSSLLAADPASARAQAEQALALGRTVADHTAMGVALSVQSRLHANALDFARGRELAEHAIAAAERDRTGVAQGYLPYVFGCMSAVDEEDDAEFDRLLAIGRAHAEQPGLLWSAPAYHGLRADQLRRIGRLSEGAAEAETGLAIAEEMSSPIGAALCAAVLIETSVRQGDLAAAQRINSSIDRWLSTAVGAMGFDAVAAAQARLRGNGEILAPSAEELWAVWEFGLVTDTPVLARGLLFPLVCALINSINTGNGDVTASRSRLAAIGATIEPWSKHSAVAQSVLIRSVRLVSLGLVNDDLATALSGLDVSRHGGRRLDHADYAAAVCAMAERLGDVDTARLLYAEARSNYDAMGCVQDLVTIRSLGRRLGVRAQPGRPRTRPRTGWSSLSQVELDVARLVAGGATNREVGATLFLSPRTIETHLRNIFTKLQLDSRRALAKRFAEMDVATV